MPIGIKPPVQGNTYTFNESRLAKIVNAKTLSEAEKMGFRDRMVDRFFHNNVKRDAIRSLYASITSPAPHDSKPADLLTRFGRLRDLAAAPDRLQFQTTHNRPSEPGGAWRFELRVGDTAIYTSPAEMHDVPETSYEAFTGALKRDQTTMALRLVAEAVSTESARVLGDRTPASYALGTVQHVADNRDVQSQLKSELKNPLYCTKNFRGITPGENQDTFKASFELPSGERMEWVLNNRPATNGEFRSDQLKQALSQGEYNSLEQLLSTGFNGPQDRAVRGLANFALSDGLRKINEATGGSLNAKTLGQDLLDMQKTHPQEAFALLNELRAIPLGNTDLLEVLYGPQLRANVAPGVDALVAQLTQPGADPLDVLESAGQLSWRVLCAVGDDPDASKGLAIVRPMFAERARTMSDQALQQAFETQVALPVLVRPDGAVGQAYRGMDEALGRDADEEDLLTAIERAKPFYLANDWLLTQFDTAIAELNTRGLLDPQWLDAKHLENFEGMFEVPTPVERFLNSVIRYGLDPSEAKERAREPVAPAALLDHAIRC